LVRKLANTTLDVSGWHANRTVLQMLINKVMADNKLAYGSSSLSQ
jgi:hypothetical protein